MILHQELKSNINTNNQNSYTRKLKRTSQRTHNLFSRTTTNSYTNYQIKKKSK